MKRIFCAVFALLFTVQFGLAIGFPVASPDTVPRVKPQNFVAVTDPGQNNFQFISQKSTLDRRATWDDVRKNMLPFVNQSTISADPAATGNTLNKGKFNRVTGTNRWWFIDGLGNAFMIRNDTAATLTASNGLTKTGNVFKLGGTLTENTLIDGGAFNFTVNGIGEKTIIANDAVLSLNPNGVGDIGASCPPGGFLFFNIDGATLGMSETGPGNVDINALSGSILTLGNGGGGGFNGASLSLDYAGMFYGSADSIILLQPGVNQPVVIGQAAEQFTPDTSAILELQSVSKGFLPPRMTTAEKEGIMFAAPGLTVFDTDAQKISSFNSDLDSWENYSTGGGGSVTTASGISIENGNVVWGDSTAALADTIRSHRFIISKNPIQFKFSDNGYFSVESNSIIDFATLGAEILMSDDGGGNIHMQSSPDKFINLFSDEAHINLDGTTDAIDLTAGDGGFIRSLVNNAKISQNETASGDIQISAASQVNIYSFSEASQINLNENEIEVLSANVEFFTPKIDVSHIEGKDTPTIAAGAGAGTSPTVTISGSDISCQISVVTGTTPSVSSVIATVTYANSFTGTPRVVFSPANSSAAALGATTGVFMRGASTTTAELVSGTVGLTGLTTYLWNVITMR